jgi:Flp pilus assembly protein TadB
MRAADRLAAYWTRRKPVSGIFRLPRDAAKCRSEHLSPAQVPCQRGWAAPDGLVRPDRVTGRAALEKEEFVMLIILLVLLLALILAGAGFALHLLWWIALIVIVVWLLGFLFRAAEGTGRRRGRWYRW